MKTLKRALAAMFALTLALGVVSCGDDSSSSGTTGSSSQAESSAADSSTADSSKADESSKDDSKADESSTSNGGSSAAFKDVEQFTLKHEPYAITVDYSLPKLDGLTLKPNESAPTYFSTHVENYAIYRKEGETTGVDVYVLVKTFNAEEAEKTFTKSDKYTHKTSANGYQVAYNIEEKEDKKEWNTYVSVYGEKYRECNVYAQVHFIADQDKMNKDEFEAYMMAVVDSMKFTVENENALIKDDGSFRLYSHRLIIAPKSTIAGNECENKLYFKQFYPMAMTEFVADDLKYEITTDILSNNSGLWKNTQKKTDEYTATKIAGHDALCKLASYGLLGEFVIQLDEEHVEQVRISANYFSDGSKKKDGKSMTDLQKELTDDAHKADTLKKMGEYLEGFVNAWTEEEA